jgi:hypothetical protein
MSSLLEIKGFGTRPLFLVGRSGVLSELMTGKFE